MHRFLASLRFIAGLLALAVVSRHSLSAAQPQISGIVIDSVGHSTLRVQWKSNIPAYAQVRYGVQSGSYPYRSYSAGPIAAPSLAVTGLAPATTYYLRVTSRANEANDTDICADDSCGSFEQVITTPPEPPQHPEIPYQPATFSTEEPDTTGYAIRQVKNAPDGSCISAADGSSLQQMLNTATYGTVIEFPQGITCKIFASKLNAASYVLPAKSTDPQANGDMNSPRHRWIILRTAGGAADFPPPGVRTGPQWADKMAKLEAEERTSGAQIFTTDSTGYSHHYRIENLELTHTADPSVFPPDAIDPAPMNWLVQLWARYSNTPATWIILDRLYIHGRGAPARIRGGVTLEGVHLALINSWVDKIDYWRVYETPATSPSVSSDGLSISIPNGEFRRNMKEPPLTLSTAATATLRADSSYAGTFVGYLGPSGLTIEFSLGNAAIDCSNCASIQTRAPAAPSNQFGWFYGNISNGNFRITQVRKDPWTTSAYVTEGSMAVLGNDGAGPYEISNNHLEGYGIDVFIDQSGLRDPLPADSVLRRNHLFWNQNHRITSPTSDGYLYSVRNLWEIKRGRRFLLDGNLFEGDWTSVNNGVPVYIAASALGKAGLQDGISDVTVTNNIIRHSASGFECRGYAGTGNDPAVTQRVRIFNNLIYDINQFTYDANGPSSNGQVMEQYLACQDLAVEHNTFGSNLGKGPAQLMVIGGQGEGLSFINNILYLNFASWGGIALDGFFPSSTHPIVPKPETGSYSHILDTAFVRAANTVTPNYTFTRNLIIGGTTGSASARKDLTGSDIARYADMYPAGNIFPIGNTQAQREANAGLVNAAQNDLRLSATSSYRAGGYAGTDGMDLGANFEAIATAQGLVRNVAPVQVAATSAVFSYTAPDGRACAVDTSPNGSDWNRTWDGGGARERTAAVSGLLPGGTYDYRILCYYEQRNDQPLFDEYPADQVTRGRFRMLTDSRSDEKTIQLKPPTRRVAQVILEYGPTPALESSTTPQQCVTECSVEVPAVGSAAVVYYRWKYLDNAGAMVATSAIRAIPVR